MLLVVFAKLTLKWLSNQEVMFFLFFFDHVNLSFGIFIILSCVMESKFYQLSESTKVVDKNTPKKSRKLSVATALLNWVILRILKCGCTAILENLTSGASVR